MFEKRVSKTIPKLHIYIQTAASSVNRLLNYMPSKVRCHNRRKCVGDQTMQKPFIWIFIRHRKKCRLLASRPLKLLAQFFTVDLCTFVDSVHFKCMLCCMVTEPSRTISHISTSNHLKPSDRHLGITEFFGCRDNVWNIYCLRCQ